MALVIQPYASPTNAPRRFCCPRPIRSSGSSVTSFWLKRAATSLCSRQGLDLPSTFKSSHLDRVASERVEGAIARHDAIFEKLRLRNMTVSPLAPRSKSLEGRDLENAVAASSASRFIPQGYSVRRPDGTYSATPSTGRISVRSDRVGLEGLVEWASEIAVQLDAEAGQISSFIRNFARPLELSAIPKEVDPTFVGSTVMGLLSAIFDDDDAIRLVRLQNDEAIELTRAETELILAAFDVPFPITRRRRVLEVRRPGGGDPAIATLQIGKLRIALRSLTLPELEGIRVERRSLPLGEDPEVRTLARHIDRENLFTVLFSDLALAYIDGALFRDEALAGGGDAFLARLQPMAALADTTSEKGISTPNRPPLALVRSFARSLITSHPTRCFCATISVTSGPTSSASVRPQVRR